MKFRYLVLAYMLGVLSILVWFATLPPPRVEYVYVHTYVCEYYVEIR
jgi:hypothetical protein